MIELYPHQQEAVKKLKNGSILVGDTGSGKSVTSLFYYWKNESDRDLYIITTAKKRDSCEWHKDLANCELCTDPKFNKNHKSVYVDSWNNISKYKKVFGAFFIFDEQRVVGSGSWVKSFLKIAKANHWILLSATPGDQWKDYIPVFVANGFYRNKTDFNEQHVIFNRFAKYPQIDRYVNTGKLVKHRFDILIVMKDKRETHRNYIRCKVEYDRNLYKSIWKDRWDIYDNCPIKETGKLCYLLRRVVNSDKERISKVDEILNKHRRVIIFYNFTYELELLRELLDKRQTPYSEWNGQKHEEIPKENSWVYLVQYTAGAEGWNCIETDTIIFYSQTYSYRTKEQAAGRIDRLNTPFHELYYYNIISNAPIDIAINRALILKKNFNEKAYLSHSLA